MNPTLTIYQELRSTTLHKLALAIKLFSMPFGQHRMVHKYNTHYGHSSLTKSFLSTFSVVNFQVKGTT